MLTETKQYRHKFEGLRGVRCGYRSSDPCIIPTPISLSWDSVTCPACRKLKQDWEPETITIDTKGD